MGSHTTGTTTKGNSTLLVLPPAIASIGLALSLALSLSERGSGQRGGVQVHLLLLTCVLHRAACVCRAGHFDPARSQDQWESEEEAENQRMLEFRWYILERDLPPGSKCDEHLQFIEAARIQMEVEANDKEERRRRFRDARATARSKPHDGSAARNAAARANVGRGGAAVMRNPPNASFVSIDEDVGAPKPNLTDYESNDSFNHEGVTITELPVEPRRRSAMPSSRPTRRVPPPPTPPPSANSQPSPRSRMLQYTPDIDNDVHC